MKRSPPHQKWLAEKRARTAGKLEQASERAAKIGAIVARLAAELTALDRALVISNDLIVPSRIGIVNGWKGRYGKRGALRGAIEDVLREGAPEWMTTKAVEAAVMNRLDIVFESPAERKQWHKNTFLNAIRDGVKKGVAEREPGWVSGSAAMGRWRWKQLGVITLAELQASATHVQDRPSSNGESRSL